MDWTSAQMSAAVIAGVVALITAIITALVTTRVAGRQLHRQYQLEFASEYFARQLMADPSRSMRSFEIIKEHLGGFEENELRRILVRAGGIRFKTTGGNEMWGLLSRNREWLGTEIPQEWTMFPAQKQAAEAGRSPKIAAYGGPITRRAGAMTNLPRSARWRQTSRRVVQPFRRPLPLPASARRCVSSNSSPSTSATRTRAAWTAGEFLASPIPAYATVPEGAVPHDRARHGQAHPHRAAAMIRRRAGVNAIATKLGNHSFRGTGITAHLKNGGMIERPRR